MVRNYTERLGGKCDLKSGGFTFFCTPAEANTTLTNIYKCGIMLVLNGVVFLRGPLYCCTVPDI